MDLCIPFFDGDFSVCGEPHGPGYIWKQLIWPSTFNFHSLKIWQGREQQHKNTVLSTSKQHYEQKHKNWDDKPDNKLDIYWRI